MKSDEAVKWRLYSLTHTNASQTPIRDDAIKQLGLGLYEFGYGREARLFVRGARGRVVYAIRLSHPYDSSEIGLIKTPLIKELRFITRDFVRAFETKIR